VVGIIQHFEGRDKAEEFLAAQGYTRNAETGRWLAPTGLATTAARTKKTIPMGKPIDDALLADGLGAFIDVFVNYHAGKEGDKLARWIMGLLQDPRFAEVAPLLEQFHKLPAEIYRRIVEIAKDEPKVAAAIGRIKLAARAWGSDPHAGGGHYIPDTGVLPSHSAIDCPGCKFGTLGGCPRGGMSCRDCGREYPKYPDISEVISPEEAYLNDVNFQITEGDKLDRKTVEKAAGIILSRKGRAEAEKFLASQGYTRNSETGKWFAPAEPTAAVEKKTIPMGEPTNETGKKVAAVIADIKPAQRKRKKQLQEPDEKSKSRAREMAIHKTTDLRTGLAEDDEAEAWADSDESFYTT
jgi:hypothetical protein